MSTKLVDYENPASMGSRFRAKRIKPLLSLIEAVHNSKGSVSILDIGGRRSYWNIVPSGLLEKYNVSIGLLNLPSEVRSEDDDRFYHVMGDACNCPELQDLSFDIVHSNSVIEHVGGWAKMKRFADEVKRLAPSHFVQTPYFWFPIEPHFLTPFFHWLPRPWRVALLLKFNLGNRKRATNLEKAIIGVESEPVLLDQKSFQLLFPSSKIIKEKYFLFTKSLTAYSVSSELGDNID